MTDEVQQGFIIDFGQFVKQFSKCIKSLVGFLDFTRIDKYVVHFCGEDGVGELAEERLEQGGHHIHVVPLGVVQLKQTFLSASIDLKKN